LALRVPEAAAGATVTVSIGQGVNGAGPAWQATWGVPGS